tara:strand:- start:3952 stop:4125 length:174 start_codon:yes stop_codon:yes gene_type:complete
MKLNNINYLETLNNYQFTINDDDDMFIIVDGEEINLNDVISERRDLDEYLETINEEV